jgi:hypothetical protein
MMHLTHLEVIGILIPGFARHHFNADTAEL